jgi:hypothetical protein
MRVRFIFFFLKTILQHKLRKFRLVLGQGVGGFVAEHAEGNRTEELVRVCLFGADVAANLDPVDAEQDTPQGYCGVVHGGEVISTLWMKALLER